jgi:hypothetical protein
MNFTPKSIKRVIPWPASSKQNNMGDRTVEETTPISVARRRVGGEHVHG